MERIVRRIGLVGIVPVAVTALAGAGILLAADDDPASAGGDGRGSSLWSPFLANQEPEGGTTEIAIGGPMFDGYLEKLAEKLGVSEEELRAAMKETALELLDEAVANGDIPEEVADDLRKAIESGKLGGGFALPGVGGSMEIGPDGPGGLHVAGPFFDDEALADYLGISTEALRDELNSGKTLAQVGEAHGKSRDELKSFLSDLQDDQLQAAVDAGKLSASEADQIRSRMAEHIDAMLDGTIRIHVEGDGPLPGGFGEKIEGFFGDRVPRSFPWRSAPEPNESTETDETY